jgi:hypothetical protein
MKTNIRNKKLERACYLGMPLRTSFGFPNASGLTLPSSYESITIAMWVT